MRDTVPWHRVKDKITGHTYSVRYVDPERHTKVQGPAADGRGNALPPVYAEKVTADYEAKSVADLKAEIERRNETREDGEKLATSGTKTDLIAVLTGDDNTPEG